MTLSKVLPFNMSTHAFLIIVIHQIFHLFCIRSEHFDYHITLSARLFFRHKAEVLGYECTHYEDRVEDVVLEGKQCQAHVGKYEVLS